MSISASERRRLILENLTGRLRESSTGLADARVRLARARAGLERAVAEPAGDIASARLTYRSARHQLEVQLSHLVRAGNEGSQLLETVGKPSGSDVAALTGYRIGLGRRVESFTHDTAVEKARAVVDDLDPTISRFVAGALADQLTKLFASLGLGRDAHAQRVVSDLDRLSQSRGFAELHRLTAAGLGLVREVGAELQADDELMAVALSLGRDRAGLGTNSVLTWG